MANENIQVAVRIRPFNDKEKRKQSTPCLTKEGNTISIQGRNKSPQSFEYDYVYGLDPADAKQDDLQEQILQELATGPLEAVWEGYNCTIFAYGQTGSGKSYTIMNLNQNEGLVPRITRELFQHMNDNETENITFQVFFSMLEIYNESVNDLLNDKGMNLKIREKDGEFEVPNLQRLAVTKYEDVCRSLTNGYKKRSIATTKMNEKSSRAHTIVRFVLKTMNRETQKEKRSILNMVDLAGSERQKDAQTSGQRFQEAKKINLSLSTLGRVIDSLATNDKLHVPYRESKLTQLLKTSLGGNSKTIMLATVSPTMECIDDTVSTLKYAFRAKSISNKVEVNESELQAQVRGLLDQLANLRRELSTQVEGRERLEAEMERIRRELRNVAAVGGNNVLEMTRINQEMEEGLWADINDSMWKHCPYLSALNEDSSLTKLLRYPIKKERSLMVGSCKPPDRAIQEYIEVPGTGKKTEHAVLENQDGAIYITALEGIVLVNGKDIVANTATKLQHRDRIMLDYFNGLYVFIDPTTHPDDVKVEDITYDSAKEEVLQNRSCDGESEVGGPEMIKTVRERNLEIRRANAFAIELNKPVKFELLLTSGLFFGITEKEDLENPVIVVIAEDMRTNCSYILSDNEFKDAYQMMDGYANNPSESSEKDDPFLFDVEFTQIGYAVVSLRPVAHVKNIEAEEFKIRDERNNKKGTLSLSIIQCTAQWERRSDTPRRMNHMYCKVLIHAAKVDSKYYQKVKCKFSLFDPDVIEETNESSVEDFDINYEYRWSMSPFTQDYRKLLSDGFIVIRVYAKPVKSSTNYDFNRGSEAEVGAKLKWLLKERKMEQETKKEYKNLYERTKKELNDHKELNEDLNAKYKESEQLREKIQEENKTLQGKVQELETTNEDLRNNLAQRSKEYDELWTKMNQNIVAKRTESQMSKTATPRVEEEHEQKEETNEGNGTDESESA